MENIKKMPKNVCQMEGRDENLRVYLEDYVNVFLKKIVAEDVASVGVFLGERCQTEEGPCVFIRGALLLDGVILPGGSVRVDENVRTSMQQQAERCFPGEGIIGWFVSGDVGERLDAYQSQKIKRQLLLARETVFSVNDEEGRRFYRMTGEDCLALAGYYIYYEKNRSMQEYMLVTSLSRKVEAKEQETARVVRQVLEEHQEAKRRRVSGRLAYGLCTMLALVLAASGSIILQQKSRPGLQQETRDPMNVVIQEVQGNVYPTEEIMEAQGTTVAPETESVLSQAPGEADRLHTVQEGETWEQIAQAYYGRSDDMLLAWLREVNSLTAETLLQPGQQIKLPNP